MLNRETILEALRQLSERLQVREVVGEINLLSGTALVLGFQARQSTKDVDAISHQSVSSGRTVQSPNQQTCTAGCVKAGAKYVFLSGDRSTRSRTRRLREWHRTPAPAFS